MRERVMGGLRWRVVATVAAVLLAGCAQSVDGAESVDNRLTVN
jgi:hypothetical protein